MTPGQILSAIVLTMVISAAGTWQMQEWLMGKKLAEQTVLHQADLAEIGKAAAGQVSADQDKRLATEQQLAASDQQHIKELFDAQRNQALLRDRLATTYARLSVLSTPRIQPAAAMCLPLPAPSTWFMQLVEPNLTQRMLSELSPSPTMG